MTFRDREKQRLLSLKPQLFSVEACEPGIYRNVPRCFCLRQDRAEENLHTTIRCEAINYFKTRRISWHDGKENRPSNHLCCSQCCCVNFWFPFVRAPEALAAVLRNLGYDVAKILPSIGSDIHQIWAKLVNSERFSGVYLENLLPLVCQYAPKPTWATYMKLRYGDMQ